MDDELVDYHRRQAEAGMKTFDPLKRIRQMWFVRSLPLHNMWLSQHHPPNWMVGGIFGTLTIILPVVNHARISVVRHFWKEEDGILEVGSMLL